MNVPDFPEDVLRVIWQRQLFNTTHLRTRDGRAIAVLSPGVPNTDAGPDFVNARIRIGAITYRGDVELHRNASAWKAHSHDTNPRYNRVILHVVLTADDIHPPARTASKRSLPLLVLHPFLDPTLQISISHTLFGDDVERSDTLKCRDRNDDVSTTVIKSWVDTLGNARIEWKVRRFADRLKQLVDERRATVREPYPRYYGDPREIPQPQSTYTQTDFAVRQLWEQLLYEGIMEGMGYSKNQEPFLSLARSMRLEILRAHDLSDVQSMMALLFGAAGLLPSSRTLKQKQERGYVRTLARRWREFRPGFKGEVLHEGDWLFFRLRPSNFPTARLAAMSFLLPHLLSDSAFHRIVGVLSDESITPKASHARLLSLFAFTPDEFWKNHVRFHGTAARSGISVGPDRVNEILVNALLPIVLLYARIFRRQSIRSRALALLSVIPGSQTNAVTRLMARQLVKDRFTMTSTARRQGLIHLFKCYCSHAACKECEIGKRVFIQA